MDITTLEQLLKEVPTKDLLEIILNRTNKAKRKAFYYGDKVTNNHYSFLEDILLLAVNFMEDFVPDKEEQEHD